MDPFNLAPWKENEKEIQARIVRELQRKGWLVHKVHGSRYMSGWPDLWLAHREHGTRWLEIKRPGGKLRASQRRKFALWESYGVGVWVAWSLDQVPGILQEGPNWRACE